MISTGDAINMLYSAISLMEGRLKRLCAGVGAVDVEVELTGLEMAEVASVLDDADEAECKNAVLAYRENGGESPG
jgi:hypothetical protein